MTDVLRIGDTVLWRGSFGREPAVPAVIENMQITDYPHSKYGEDADEVPIQLVQENRVVFDLTNGHWCYSQQIVLPPND